MFEKVIGLEFTVLKNAPKYLHAVAFLYVSQGQNGAGLLATCDGDQWRSYGGQGYAASGTMP